jgi:integrase-like protein
MGAEPHQTTPRLRRPHQRSTRPLRTAPQLHKARESAGAPPLPFHALRHTAASLLVRKLDPTTVHAILGHTSIKTTERYMHPRRAADLANHVTNARTPPARVAIDDDGDRELLRAIGAPPLERRKQQLATANEDHSQTSR